MADARIPLTTKMSNRIKKAREDKKLTQAALGTKAKVPRARVKRIECFQLSTISVAEYKSLCKALGLKYAIKEPAKKTKVPTKSKAKLPAKTMSVSKHMNSRLPPKKTTDRKALVKKLEDAGVLDMTLRELLAS
jgi:transcriptional regulator with XRE-family HTH domain